ncbi:MAG: hypothetical protein ACLPOO_18910 [Terriglobales bacterium]
MGLLAVAFGAYVWCFGPQSMFVLEARYLAHKAPVVEETPSDLPDSSVSAPVKTKVSYFGYEFGIPWSDVDEPATKVYRNRVVIAFKSGLRLMFVTGPPKEFVKAVLSSGKIDTTTFRQIYGDAMESDYALTRLMLESTPEKVSLLGPKKDAVGRAMMLAIKAIAVPENSGMFSVQTRDFKGFQYGEPLNTPKRIIVDLFTDDGSLEFMFFKQDQGIPNTVAPVDRQVTVSQPEINAVVQSVRKTVPEPNRSSTS